jgi:hypothetical protein
MRGNISKTVAIDQGIHNHRPASGIGRCTALELAKHCAVVLVGRDRRKLDEMQKVIERKGQLAISVVRDLSDPASAQPGIYNDEGGHPMLGSALVRDPNFHDRVVAQTRALLAKNFKTNGGEIISFTPAVRQAELDENTPLGDRRLTNQ